MSCLLIDFDAMKIAPVKNILMCVSIFDSKSYI